MTEVGIGSGDGLAPKRRQAIAWTNDDPVRSTHIMLYASQDTNELSRVLGSTPFGEKAPLLLSSYRYQY